jgi:hypothetical protein
VDIWNSSGINPFSGSHISLLPLPQRSGHDGPGDRYVPDRRVRSAIKESAIVSLISIQELTFEAMELMAATYPVFEVRIKVTVLSL